MTGLKVALDATYSIGRELSGVGVYSREILSGLAARTDAEWVWCYRPHRFLRSIHKSTVAARRPLFDWWVPDADLFHGLNQRLPRARLRRSVVTFHDLFVMTSEYSTPDFRHRFSQQAREAAARADFAIAVSEFTAGQVTALLAVERSRIEVIPHGVHIPPMIQTAREPLVLCVGAIQKRKNTARLVEAFERMPPGWRLVLAGSRGYGWEEISTRIEASRRREDIEVTGWVSRQRLGELYSQASIFAFPSLEEGFGIPVLEAMAHGAPVITSRTSALPEAAGDAAIQVDPLNTEELATAMQKLAGDPGLRADLAERGLRRARGFGWEKAVERTWEVYRRVAG